MKFKVGDVVKWYPYRGIGWTIELIQDIDEDGDYVTEILYVNGIKTITVGEQSFITYDDLKFCTLSKNYNTPLWKLLHRID